MQPRKASSPDGAPSLSGRISRVSIADLLATLESRGTSAVVRFSTPSGTAQVWFSQGRLVDAEVDTLNGEPALFRILGFSEGQFDVLNDAASRPRVIHDGVASLIAKRSRRAARWEDLVFGGPALDGIPVKPASVPATEPDSADERKLLKLINGQRTLLEVLDESGIDPVQALEALGRLQSAGHFTIERLASYRPPPPRPDPVPERENKRHSAPGAAAPLPAQAPRNPGTLLGLVAVDPQGENRPPPLRGAGERSQVSTLMGPADPSWFEPPPGHVPGGSEPPDSDPAVASEPAPHESGLTDARLRARTSRPPRESWPSVEVSEPGSLPPEPAPSSLAPSVRPASVAPTSLGATGALIGPYQVLSRLASGRQSSVFLCREAENGSVRQLFAVKVFEPPAQSALALDEFNAAARRAGSFVHPNATRFLGSGSIDGRPLMVSEYVEGCSFSALLRRHTEPGSRPIPLVIAVLFDALRGLQAAHEAPDIELVHGELCPRDLLLSQTGECRVADLHANYALRAAGLYESPRDPAKLAYLAPECLLGRPADARSDVFSMGILLYEALTGLEPFAGEGGPARRGAVEPPSRVGFRPPELYDLVCLRALELEPENRYASIREFLLALEQAALEHHTLASSIDVAAWVQSTFGREIELRRLGILDASRRSRRGGQAPSVPPPSVQPRAATPAHVAGDAASGVSATAPTLPSVTLAPELLATTRPTPTAPPASRAAPAMSEAEIDALIPKQRAAIGPVGLGLLGALVLAFGGYWFFVRGNGPRVADPPAATPPEPVVVTPPTPPTLSAAAQAVPPAPEPPPQQPPEPSRVAPQAAPPTPRTPAAPALRPRALTPRPSPPASPAPAAPEPAEPAEPSTPLEPSPGAGEDVTPPGDAEPPPASPPSDADPPPAPPPYDGGQPSPAPAPDPDYRYGI